MNDNGSLRGASSLDAYYKAPVALAEAGWKREANLIMNWIIASYASGDGYYKDVATVPQSTRRADLYQTLWIAWGANILERHEIANEALAYAIRYLDPTDGGFYSLTTGDYGAQGKDLRSTALAGLVSAVMGRMDYAVAAASFVISLLNSQPQLESQSFFLVCDRSGNVVTSFPSESERYFVINGEQARPLYYALGLAVAFLAKLALLTSDRQYLSAARAYVDVCASYGHRLLRHDYAGKLAWGLALIYAQTGERILDVRLVEICDYLCSLQQPRGEWSASFLPSMEVAKLGHANLSYDRTAEYSLWLTYVRQGY